MEQQRYIEHLIEKYQAIKEKHVAQHKTVFEYSTFKKYTSSRREDAPHARLFYNVRKPWPLVCSNYKNIPKKFGGEQLLSDEREIGEHDSVRASILTADYLFKYGKPATKEVVDAFMVVERNRVNKRFSVDLGNIRFDSYLPIRKLVHFEPIIPNVPQACVNPTIMKALFSDLAPVDLIYQSIPDKVRELQRILHPLMQYRSMASTVHLARSCITPISRWLPVIADTSNTINELSYFLYSNYHQVEVNEDLIATHGGVERLCSEIIKHALAYKDRAKEKCLEFCNSVHVTGVSLESVVEEVRNEGPFTNIIRSLLGYPIKSGKTIRRTKFELLDSEYPRTPITIKKRFMGIEWEHTFECFTGFWKVYFANRGIRGYAQGSSRVVNGIWLLAEKGTDIIDAMIDLHKYAAAVHTGFEGDFPSFVSKKEHWEKFYMYHKDNPIELYRSLGITNHGYVSNSFIVGEKSKGYLQKVRQQTENVQPYTTSNYHTEVDNRLKVYIKKPMYTELIYDPEEIPFYRNAPLPTGLSVTAPELMSMHRSALMQLEFMVKDYIPDKHKMQELVAATLSEAETPITSAFKSIIKPQPSTSVMKRKLSSYLEANLDWAETPAKRVKAFYYVCGSNAPQQKTRKRRYDETTLSLIDDTGFIEPSLKRGVLTANKNTVKFLGKPVTHTSWGTNSEYIAVCYTTMKPEFLVCSSMEDAHNRSLTRFCMQSSGCWITFEKKEARWTEAENIRKALDNRRKEIRLFEGESRLLKMMSQ
uniref:Polymerase subunit PB2 n=1 Tax=Varroa orthomyxovirus-1 TaxID=2510845 RepID=A0A8K1R1I0_9ORTO|nr:MAG: polymerase subunit PB2 [Varroa orthomyxovirus-1]